MALVLIGVLLRSILILFSFIILIRGLFHLFAGKCKVRGSLLQGREARIVGLVFFLQFPAAMIPLAIIYEVYELGSSGGSTAQSLANNLTFDFFSIVFFLPAILGSYFWAKAYAKKAGESQAHPVLNRGE